MTIVTVPSDGQLFAQVVSLGGQNSRTLGFFPEGAFRDYASRGHVLAWVESQRVAGYLLFRIHHMTVVLVHLCVAKPFRGRGIARDLVDQLCSQSVDFSGIRARCRVDFPADAMWPRLGFVARNEIPGRATRAPTTLRIWWRDLGLPDLFSTAPADRTVAALDTSVIIDMHAASEDPSVHESKALLAPWLADSIEYVVTDETYTDISRNPVPEERRAIREYASAFRSVSDVTPSVTKALLVNLSDTIGPPTTSQDRSDHRHLALAAADRVPYFVTRDTALLDAASEIDTSLGVAVVRPCDIIARTHSELTDQNLSPRRLSGSRLSIRPFVPADIDHLRPTFQSFDQGETKGPLIGALRDCLALADRNKGLVILAPDGKPQGLLVVGVGEDETTIQILRTTRGAMGDVLSRHLVWLAMQEARRLGHSVTRLVDKHIPPAAQGVLGALGFRPADKGMVKLNGIHVRTTADLAKALRSMRSVYDDHTWIDVTVDGVEGGTLRLPQQLVYELERTTWPAKLLDTRLPSYVVPIHPEWAAQLFHSQLAEQSLFGSNPKLMLRLENVYYRSARPKRIQAPARVLWYVTASKERPSTKCIAATSLIGEVVHGAAKEVFSQFKRYGVYEWGDVINLSGGDPHSPIEAFRFGHTESFANPVGLQRVRQLIRQAGGQELVLQSPSRVRSDIFGAIYEEGVGHRE